MSTVSSTAFGRFASEAEDPLGRIRAELFACHHMLDTQHSIGLETQKAVDVLIATSLERVESLLDAHGDAFRKFREEDAS